MKRMGEGYEADVSKVTKANEGVVDVLTIYRRDRKDTASPSFYLLPLFQEYRGGRGMDSIVGDIVDTYHARAGYGQRVAGSLGGIREYGNCRHKVYFRLVNTERNKVYLKDVLHFEVLDLSMVFYVLASEDSGGIVAVAIKDVLLNCWGVPAGEIMAQAWRNTPGMFPVKVQPLAAVLEGLLHGAGEEGRREAHLEASHEIYGQAEPHIMTNTKGMNGFSAVLYPEAPKSFSGVTGTDLYILPSSLHEAILLPVDSYIEPQEL